MRDLLPHLIRIGLGFTLGYVLVRATFAYRDRQERRKVAPHPSRTMAEDYLCAACFERVAPRSEAVKRMSLEGFEEPHILLCPDCWELGESH